MKFQKTVKLSGEFGKVKVDFKDGDIVTILDAGTEIANRFDAEKKQYVFKIKTKNGEKLVNFNGTTRNNLVEAFGEESNHWVKQKVKVWVIKQNVSGVLRDVVYFAEPSWEMGDKGFENPNEDVLDADEIPLPEEEN